MFLRNLIHNFKLYLALLALCLPLLAKAQAVYLNAVGMPYTQVTAQAEEIARLGFSAIVVVPPSAIDAPECQSDMAIYLCLGNQAEFIALNRVLQQLGIQLYADLLLDAAVAKTPQVLAQKVMSLYQLGVNGFRLEHGAREYINKQLPSIYNDIALEKNTFLLISEDIQAVSYFAESDEAEKLVEVSFKQQHMNRQDFNKSLSQQLVQMRMAQMNQDAQSHVDSDEGNHKVIIELAYQAVNQIAHGYGYLASDEQLLINAYLFGRKTGVPMVTVGLTHGSATSLDNLSLEQELLAMIEFRNGVAQADAEKATQLSDCLLVFQRGHNGFVALNHCDDAQVIKIPKAIGIPTNRYKNTLSEKNFLIERVIMPNSYAMWLRQ